MLVVTFLGTSAARPTVERNVSALTITREGETLLFDCGEGTQRQMMRYGVSFALREVFITHFHADHYLGLIGLVRTFGLQGREEPLHLYGPAGAARLIKQTLAVGVERAPFEVQITEVAPGDRLERGDYDLEVFRADHGRGAVGYALREHERLGRFDPDRARAAGIPEGPLWGKLHRGEEVTLEDGRTVGSTDLVGPPRPGRTVVLSGDTAPSDDVVKASRGADLLVHEATFSQEEAERARETGHSTAMDAAKVALAAGVGQLALTHISARHSVNGDVLLEEARAVFAKTVVARDGMRIDVPFQEGA